MKRELAAFAELDITETAVLIWARFYWSKNSGKYGHQVILEYNIGNGFKKYVTNGCGFNKATAALEHFIKEVTGEYSDLGGDLEYHLRGTKYHKGGNYYELPISKLSSLTEIKKEV